MATSRSNTTAGAVDTRVVATVVGAGLVAAVGSVFVAIGLTDLLSYAEGYRPNYWIVLGYAQAFLVTAVGWSFLSAALVGTARAALSCRGVPTE